MIKFLVLAGVEFKNTSHCAGNGVEVNDAGETNDVSGLFVYTLRSFPTLDKYWAQTRYEGHLSGHSTAEQRLDALMKERYCLSTPCFCFFITQNKYCLKMMSTLRGYLSSKDSALYIFKYFKTVIISF